MNYLKRIILLLACLSLIFTLTTIKDTYSKYKTDLTGTTNIKVARWRILVNNKVFSIVSPSYEIIVLFTLLPQILRFSACQITNIQSRDIRFCLQGLCKPHASV